MTLQRPILNKALGKFGSKAEIKREIATPFRFCFNSPKNLRQSRLTSF
jgi:hypothetical protein